MYDLPRKGEAFVLGADHAARVNLQHHRAGGELAEAFGHEDHGLMDRVVGGKAVPQTEYLDAAGGPCGPDGEGRDGGGDETGRQDVENPPGQGIRERLMGLLGLRHDADTCPFANKKVIKDDDGLLYFSIETEKIKQKCARERK